MDESAPKGLYLVAGILLSILIITLASPEVIVHVTTNVLSKNYTSASYNASDVNDSNYIEENANFDATLNKNGNGSIIGITFIQK